MNQGNHRKRAEHYLNMAKKLSAFPSEMNKPLQEYNFRCAQIHALIALIPDYSTNSADDEPTRPEVIGEQLNMEAEERRDD